MIEAAEPTHLDEELLDLSVDVLALPLRLDRIVQRRGLSTVRQLVEVDPETLLSEPNLGKKSLLDARTAIRAILGMSWEHVHARLRPEGRDVGTGGIAGGRDEWAYLRVHGLATAMNDGLIAIGLPTRMVTLARDRGLGTLGELLAIPYDELRELPGIGRLTLAHTLISSGPSSTEPLPGPPARSRSERAGGP